MKERKRQRKTKTLSNDKCTQKQRKKNEKRGAATARGVSRGKVEGERAGTGGKGAPSRECRTLLGVIERAFDLVRVCAGGRGRGAVEKEEVMGVGGARTRVDEGGATNEPEKRAANARRGTFEEGRGKPHAAMAVSCQRQLHFAVFFSFQPKKKRKKHKTYLHN